MERIMDKLLKLGANDVVIQKQINFTNLIKFSENRINTIKSGAYESISLFIAKGKRIMLTRVKDASEFDNVAAGLMRFLEVLPDNREYEGIAEGIFKYKRPEQIYDKRILGLDAVDYVEKGINCALAEGARRCAGVFEHGSFENELLTSKGIRKKEKGTHAYFSIRALVDKDASGQDVAVSRVLNGLDVASAGREAGIIARQAISPSHIEPGRHDVLFSELALSVAMLEQAGEFASVFNVESGLSCFAGKMGKNVASGIVNIYDNGLLANGFASSSFDAEGYPCQRTQIVKNGVLKGYLHNFSTAKRYKTKSTGNAGLIAPSASNVVLGKGKSKDILCEMKNGLYVTNVWYTRYNNYLTGDFSTIPRDGVFLVRNGEIVRPVKGIRISGNVIEMLKNISAIGNKQKQVHSWEVSGSVFTPKAIIRAVNITKPLEHIGSGQL